MQYSNDQLTAYDKIMKWFKDPNDKHFVLSGYAGTGKTTLAKKIADSVGHDNCIFLSFTGKAANVLREKGCSNAGTIHSSLYRPERHKDDKGKVVFSRRPTVEFITSPLIVIDEYSMLNDQMISDINNNTKKVLYLGDPFQLGPVKGNQTLLNPDFTLEEVHRQALDSPILRFATEIRKGANIQHCDWGDFKYVQRDTLSNEQYLLADQFICGNNETKAKFNEFFRRKSNYTSTLPSKGEKIMITKNNPQDGVFNGTIDTCLSNAVPHGSQGYYIRLQDSGNLKFINDPKKYNFDIHKELNTLEFAYALTCHKSQGSEFDNVIVYNEPPVFTNIERRRWLYTAATRAKKTLILTDAKKKE